nr:polysaccharide deacetylase family protein [Parvularcula dongshanensis]
MLAACGQTTAETASADKRIAITYDDAPLPDGPHLTGAERGAALIEALAAAESGPVAVFVTTDGLADEPDGRERIEAYAAAGHLIANHSHTHPHLSEMTADAYLANLDEAERQLAGFENRRPWFRFPYLDEGGQDRAKRDAVRAGLAERGLMSGYVTVDTYDWHVQSRWDEAARAGRQADLDALREVYVAMVLDAAEHYDALSRARLGRAPAQVLLLHENDLAALFAGDMIAALRDAGWQIVSPDEAFADEIAENLPDGLFSGMGRVSALAFEAGARGDELGHWSVDADAIDARLEKAEAFSD